MLVKNIDGQVSINAKYSRMSIILPLAVISKSEPFLITRLVFCSVWLRLIDAWHYSNVSIYQIFILIDVRIAYTAGAEKHAAQLVASSKIFQLDNLHAEDKSIYGLRNALKVSYKVSGSFLLDDIISKDVMLDIDSG